MRVDQFGELGEDLHHLVGAFAAGSHHDHLGVALLGDGVLQHGLAAAERARDKARTAFGNRVERVHAAYAGLHDAVGAGLLDISADGHLDRPALDHRHLVLLAVGIGQDGHLVVDPVVAFGRDALDFVFTLEREGDHDFVREPAFLDFAQPVGGVHRVAGLGNRGEMPDLVVVQRCGIFAAFEEYVLHRGEVVLQTVVAAGEQARSELDLEHVALEFDLVALAQAAGALINLHEGVPARHLDDLGHHFRAAQVDVADLVLRHVAFETHRHQVGDDSGNYTCSFHYLFFIFVLL